MVTEGRLSATLRYHSAGETETGERTIGDALEVAARHWGGATALVGHADGGTRRTWTFAELRDDAKRVARALIRRYRPGENVAIWAANRPEWPLIQYRRGIGRGHPRDGESRRTGPQR